MDYLHYEIIALIIRRRSALSQVQIEHSISGYKSHLIATALYAMTNNGLMTCVTEKGKTFYQLTLAGLNEYEKGLQS